MILALLIIIILFFCYKGEVKKHTEKLKEILWIKNVYEEKIIKIHTKHQQEIQKATKQALTSFRNHIKREVSEIFSLFRTVLRIKHAIAYL